MPLLRLPALALAAAASVALAAPTLAAAAPAPNLLAAGTVPLAAQPSAVVTPDLNGDGRPDVVATQPAGDAIAAMVNQTAAGATATSFTSASFPLPPGSSPVALSG